MKGPPETPSQSGNVLFFILVALFLFAGLSYAVTSSSRTGSQNVETEEESIERAVVHSCETQVNTAYTRLRVRGCEGYEISYELPDGSNSNPNAPSDKSCHIFHPYGAGASPCSQNEQLVEWTNGVGVTISGNTITNTSTTGWGNAGASSTQVLPANTDGYIKTTLNGAKLFFGWSATDTDQNFPSIQYGMHNRGGGNLEPFISGSKKSPFGTWANGDVVELSRDNGVISYKKNGSTFYVAPGTYNGPLVVDVSVYTLNMQVINTYVSEGFE